MPSSRTHKSRYVGMHAVTKEKMCGECGKYSHLFQGDIQVIVEATGEQVVQYTEQDAPGG